MPTWVPSLVKNPLLQCLKTRKLLGPLPTCCTNVSDRPLAVARTLTSEITRLRNEFFMSFKSWGIDNFLVGCFFPRSSSDNHLIDLHDFDTGSGVSRRVNYSLGFVHVVLRKALVTAAQGVWLFKCIKWPWKSCSDFSFKLCREYFHLSL